MPKLRTLTPATLKTRKPAKENDLGEISRDKLYPLPVFRRITGLGKHALTQLRRKGLPTVKCGNRVFVRGADFDTFVSNQSATAK